MSWWKCDWFFCLILAVVTMLAYQPAWNGGLLWNDDSQYRDSRVAFPGWFEANLGPSHGPTRLNAHRVLTAVGAVG